MRESGLILLKAALSADPVSGTIVQAIDGFRAAAREKATATMMEDFAKRLAELESEGRLDGAFVATDDFADLFKSCVSLADRTNKDEKLRAAANILANSLLRQGDDDKLPFDELDHFVRCLERLARPALEVFAKIHELGIKERPELAVAFTTLPIGALYKRLPAVDKNLVDAQLEELTQAGFVQTVREPPRPRPRVQVKRPNEQGVYPSDPPRARDDVRMTQLGWRFRAYILRDAAEG
jgi:hypothetical protein